MIDRSTAPLEMFGEPDDTECPHGIPTGMGVECWECRYDQLKIDYDALERERDELQEELHQKLMYSGGEISRLEADNGLLIKRLEVACHVKADDKVGFDFAILDKMDALERERDELTERVRELAAEIAEPTIKELDILYRIRKAIGDNGKMMQDELVDHIEGLARQLEKVQGLEADCEGWKNGLLQMQDISESLFVSNNELGRLLKEARAENALLRKRLENFEKLWEWMRFTDKYHFCEDNGIRIEDMERKEG